ncbi:MAG: histidine kinase, partial [Flavobacteriales bacterium]|nr:histidine kinase [Flavobacteriales bacterium]
MSQKGFGLVWWNKSVASPHFVDSITSGLFVKSVQFISDSSFLVVSEKGAELILYKEGQFSSDLLSDGSMQEELESAFVGGDSIYLLYDDGFFIKRLSDLKKTVLTHLPKLEVKRILLNDSILIFRDQLKQLTSQQNNLSFQISFISYAYFNDITVQYRLNDQQWRKLVHDNIDLSVLLHGTYLLQVRMIYKDKLVSDILSIPFTIYPPLYKRPWFIGLISLIVVVLSFLLGKYLSNKKQDVLNEKLLKQKAQLNALQAQINPHFLFNV